MVSMMPRFSLRVQYLLAAIGVTPWTPSHRRGDRGDREMIHLAGNEVWTPIPGIAHALLRDLSRPAGQRVWAIAGLFPRDPAALGAATFEEPAAQGA